ncbi:MAG: cupin domain-containing protein [Anaerolineae bacterium]|nr:cupin domain-containing protein [Anaerolineae bacterium]
MKESYTFLSDISSHLKDIPDDSIVSKTLLKNDDCKVVLFGMAAGQELTEHKVSHPAMLHFLTGEIDLVLEGKQITAQPCSWVHMPGNMPHSVKAVTPATFLLVILKG